MMALNHDEITGKLSSRFGQEAVTFEISADFLNVTVSPEQIHDVLDFLKNDPSTNFMYLTDLCGVHMPEQKGKEIGVVYHLHNFIENYRLRVKTWLPAENPKVPTVTDLWLGANWMERETYDFFGIQFSGHPDLRRILNVDHMDIFPMLKEYPLEDTTRTDKDDRFFGR